MWHRTIKFQHDCVSCSLRCISHGAGAGKEDKYWLLNMNSLQAKRRMVANNVTGRTPHATQLKAPIRSSPPQGNATPACFINSSTSTSVSGSTHSSKKRELVSQRIYEVNQKKGTRTVLSMSHPRRVRARIPRSKNKLPTELRHISLFTDMGGVTETAL